MRELLEWTYARQIVQRDEGGFGPGEASISATGRVCGDLATGAVIRAQGMKLGIKAHADAYTVHDFVRRLQAGERQLVMRCAEDERTPDWCPRCPPLRVVAELKAGLPRTLKDRRGKPVACVIDYEGWPPARAEAALWHARATYETWHCALRILRDAMMAADALTRWRLTGIGAEREPWGVR
ncbi:hypothetical protein [Rhodomicrobium lacus]|uniref:hypothetical protein n=1 Tax=Rhodomicrobium lacus TaxID=2498452 RepID=UPI000F8D5047|nr:hypothetical protein [Rhodomicrobium lacus]